VLRGEFVCCGCSRGVRVPVFWCVCGLTLCLECEAESVPGVCAGTGGKPIGGVPIGAADG